MLFDSTLASEYGDFRQVKLPQHKECDYHCRLTWYCQVSSSDYDEMHFCAKKGHNAFFDKDYFFQALFDVLVPHWYEPVA